MGFFNFMRSARDEAHGVRLERHLNEQIAVLKSLDNERQNAVIQDFSSRLVSLEDQLPNMTDKGRLEMGLRLQIEGKKRKDFNIHESLVLWLQGLWLEARERDSENAKRASRYLNELAGGMRF